MTDQFQIGIIRYHYIKTQDLQDDTLLGLGSTARRFGDSTKLWLSAFSSLMITSLAATGVYADLSWPYYIGLSGVSAHLIWQVYVLRLSQLAYGLLKKIPYCPFFLPISDLHIGY